MDEIKKTLLGSVLWDFGCFINQPAPARRTSSASGEAGTAGEGTATLPQNDFKSRGPLSGSAVDILSTPGQKEFLSGKIFCIIGSDAAGKPLEDCAYIRPVEADVKTQQKYVVTVGGKQTNKILFGKAKGYGFCPCLFATMEDANDFLGKINISNFKLDQKVTSIGLAKKSSMASGYFKIGTEFGPCYISAQKLNEELVEEVEQVVEEKKEEKLSNQACWEACYGDTYFKD